MNAILGGVIIGSAVSLFLLFNGRVTGISGIIGSLLNKETKEKNWRLAFIAGLFTGGIVLRFVYEDSFNILTSSKLSDYIWAGLLVGFGTQMANGCTSGHGVCGMSRLSLRSIIATFVFMLFGITSVFLFKKLRGEI